LRRIFVINVRWEICSFKTTVLARGHLLKEAVLKHPNHKFSIAPPMFPHRPVAPVIYPNNK
jgi:hypothetical protein